MVLSAQEGRESQSMGILRRFHLDELGVAQRASVVILPGGSFQCLQTEKEMTTAFDENRRTNKDLLRSR